MPFTLAQAQELLGALDHYDSRKSASGPMNVGPWQLVIDCYLHQASADDDVSSVTSGFIFKAQFAIAHHAALQAFFHRKGYDAGTVPTVESLTTFIQRYSDVRAVSQSNSATPRANSELIRNSAPETKNQSTTSSPRYIRAHHRRELRAYLQDMINGGPVAGDNVVHEATVDEPTDGDNDRRAGSPEPIRPVLSTEGILNEFCLANVDCFAAFEPTQPVN